jgi:hypothetical protein
MPKGPLGFPRLTSIGPFVEERGSKEFSRSDNVPSELPKGDPDSERVVGITFYQPCQKE